MPGAPGTAWRAGQSMSPSHSGSSWNPARQFCTRPRRSSQASKVRPLGFRGSAAPVSAPCAPTLTCRVPGPPVTLIDIVGNLIRNGLDFVDGFNHFDEGVDHDLAIFSFQVVECRVREIGDGSAVSGCERNHVFPYLGGQSVALSDFHGPRDAPDRPGYLVGRSGNLICRSDRIGDRCGVIQLVPGQHSPCIVGAFMFSD
jgi:hypothetical protein